jgi:hypothetical protein
VPLKQMLMPRSLWYQAHTTIKRKKAVRSTECRHRGGLIARRVKKAERSYLRDKTSSKSPCLGSKRRLLSPHPRIQLNSSFVRSAGSNSPAVGHSAVMLHESTLERVWLTKRRSREERSEPLSANF